MEILAITFALALTIVLPSDRPSVSQLAAGIEALWRPEVFLLLQTGTRYFAAARLDGQSDFSSHLSHAGLRARHTRRP
jgi:hypothetical protein